MLRPAHHSHSRHHSFENSAPCPPYIQSEQKGAMAGKDTSPETNELLLQVERIQDPVILKRMLIEKEQERQDLASNLDLAARLGLGLQQQLEHVEMESYAKLQSLQDHNLVLQSKANRSKELENQLAGSEHEVKTLAGHNLFLQRELDGCRKDLKAFRMELDELTEQMAEMGSEMMDAKVKVNSYARRLGEVEQELTATQELNVNLQIQLENALHRQKQTHSNTTQAVKLIQSDLGKVFSESDTMRMTLEELESRQVKCEGKVFEMMTNTREYAQLLEEAQDTIHNLRLESDLEGRGWSRGPQAAIWDHKTGEQPDSDPYQHNRSILAKELGRDHGSTYHDDLDPELDPDHWDNHGPVANSLGLELGRGMGLGDELARFSMSEQDSQPHRDTLADTIPGNDLSTELGAVGENTFGDSMNGHTDRPISTNTTSTADTAATITTSDAPTEPAATFDQGQPKTSVGMPLASIPHRLSLSAELHQRLEENNILQNVLSGTPRSPWASSNSGIAVGISGGQSPHQRSPSAIRSISRGFSLSSASLPSAASGTAKESSTLSHSGSVSSISSFSIDSLAPSATAAASVATSGVGASGLLSSGNSSASLSGGQTPGSTRPKSGLGLDGSHALGLKYLLSATSSSDLSNVITKTKAKTTTTTASNSTPNQTKRTRSNTLTSSHGRSSKAGSQHTASSSTGGGSNTSQTPLKTGSRASISFAPSTPTATAPMRIHTGRVSPGRVSPHRASSPGKSSSSKGSGNGNGSGRVTPTSAGSRPLLSSSLPSASSMRPGTTRTSGTGTSSGTGSGNGAMTSSSFASLGFLSSLSSSSSLSKAATSSSSSGHRRPSLPPPPQSSSAASANAGTAKQRPS